MVFFSLIILALVGGGPTATHFSCFAKKSKQKKATQAPSPFGFPFVHDKKWESFETRFAQTAKLSLSIFCCAQMALSHAIKAMARRLVGSYSFASLFRSSKP
jgi:hypothetical protein